MESPCGRPPTFRESLTNRRTMTEASYGSKRNGPIVHVLTGFACFLVIELLSPDDLRPNTKPWFSDYFAASIVLLGAFLSGVHTLPGERLNGMVFSVVGALVGGIMVSQFDFRWWVGRPDFASELVV